MNLATSLVPPPRVIYAATLPIGVPPRTSAEGRASKIPGFGTFAVRAVDIGNIRRASVAVRATHADYSRPPIMSCRILVGSAAIAISDNTIYLDDIGNLAVIRVIVVAVATRASCSTTRENRVDASC